MGQIASNVQGSKDDALLQNASVKDGKEKISIRKNRKLIPDEPWYYPLCDKENNGDASTQLPSSHLKGDSKGVIGELLEFGDSLVSLPQDIEAPLYANHQIDWDGLVNPVDSINDLFQYITDLSSSSSNLSISYRHKQLKRSVKGCVGTTLPGVFEARIGMYVRNLQHMYELVKTERYLHGQRLESAKSQAKLQKSVMPPPLPLPTQACISMGWDIALYLLRATWMDIPSHYCKALEMIKDNIKLLKPMAYADTLYLSPSASSAFNELVGCLESLVFADASTLPESSQMNLKDMRARTVELLSEMSIVRGSLSTLMSVILWLLQQSADERVDISRSISKLSEIREQNMYGRFESSGELYCCGQNSYGELALGDDIERNQLTGVALCGWEHIRQVASGNELLTVLTSEGIVLTCGLNKSGQCGHGHFEERVMCLRPVQALRSHIIKYIAASNGCEHMIAISETGLAYSWGYNDRGQLGHEDVASKIHTPKLIEAIKEKKMVSAAVSYHHSALISDTGELYTCGMNDSGQLGLDHNQHQSTPQLVKSMLGHQIRMVGCGLYHMIICTSNGELYSCGKNDYGQLGLGHNRPTKVPVQVLILNNLVSFVACGYYHSIAVTSKGSTYSFGRNDYGQLGIGSKIHQNVPISIALPSSGRIMQATCGCYHSVILSESGHAFVFGRNNKGQSGNRSNADSLLPVPLKVRPEKNTRRCLLIAAGFYTTSLLIERNRENDEGDSVSFSQNCMTSLCGRVDIDRSGEIEGLSNFGSISTLGVALYRGKWFYEVEVVTSGLIQVGWIDSYFQGSSDQGEGVGDHSHSWSYDGNRQRSWNCGSSSYGEKWKVGDVIGCLLDLDSKQMTFFRNGMNLGVAYTNFQQSPNDKKTGMMPGISLERGEIIRINLGHQAFAYPPTTTEFDGVFRAMVVTSNTAIMKQVSSTKMMLDSEAPSCLDGAACVLIQNRLFVIGGSRRTLKGSAASNKVWVYDMTTKVWERWSELAIGIRYHQAVVVNDSFIVVLGGEYDSPTSRHLDIYKCDAFRNADNSLPQWELIQGALGSADAFPSARAHHCAAVVSIRLDTLIFLYGGLNVENQQLGDIWYLSLDDYTWSRLPSTLSLDPGTRLGCTVCAINESVYLFGGEDHNGNLRSDLWCYNVFDRLWLLLHDDDLSLQHRDSSSGMLLALPQSRMEYSIVTDLSNIWIYGGRSENCDRLNDLWFYSLSAQKWSNVDLNVDEENMITSCFRTTLMLSHGTSSALSYNMSSKASVPDQDNKLDLLGFDDDGSGYTDLSLHAISINNSESSYDLKMRTGTISGTYNTRVMNFRAKAETEGSPCAPTALDSAVSLLSHVDRLAKTNVLASDVESVQLSNCYYRSLCIDPKQSTFDVLLRLLQTESKSFWQWHRTFDQTRSTSIPGQPVLDILYPLLVTLKIIKLNFYELLRSSSDPNEEIVASETKKLPNTLLSSIRHELFELAECPMQPPESLTAESAAFYQDVQQEIAECIYHGFSILFPTLADRLNIFKSLIREHAITPGTDEKLSKRLLLPKLFPYFTNPKILFQMIDNANANNSSIIECESRTPNIIQGVLELLMETLWLKLTVYIRKWLERDDLASPQPYEHLVHAIDAMNNMGEHRCLYLLCQVLVLWTGWTSSKNWRTVQFLVKKSVDYVRKLFAMLSSGSGECNDENILWNIAVMPHLVQHSFCGKFLPFILLSISSMPNVRRNFGDMMNDIWPSLKCLLTDIYKLMQAHERIKSRQTQLQLEIPVEVRSKVNGVINLHQTVLVSRNLSQVLFDSPTSVTLKCCQVLRSLWEYAERSGCTCRTTSHCELAHLDLSDNLAQIFKTRALLISYHAYYKESRLGDEDLRSIFSPCWVYISQHVYENVSTCMGTSTNIQRRDKGAPWNLLKKSILREIRESIPWMKDLQNILAWAGSHHASIMMSDSQGEIDTKLIERWVHSSLFKSGLDEGSDQETVNYIKNLCPNRILLQQITENTGAGKKLLDRIRNWLEDGGTSISNVATNPQLRATRLRRQDSVEVALQKSGAFEAVDRAVRSIFAAILKHSLVYYTQVHFRDDGYVSDTIVDAWRSSLQIRRWIVREQQKLAALSSESKEGMVEPISKDRQQELYKYVCEPLILRCNLLLQLHPAFLAWNAEAPLELLAGSSIKSQYETSQQSSISNQPKAEATLSVHSHTSFKEEMEEQDACIQADIFSFVQQTWPTDSVLKAQNFTNGGLDNIASPRLDIAHHMENLLTFQIKLARARAEGLTIFEEVLQYTANDHSARFYILDAISVAFKRTYPSAIRRLLDEEVRDAQTAAHYRQKYPYQTSNGVHIHKVHYLECLDFVGQANSEAIQKKLFQLFSSILQSSTIQLVEYNKKRTSLDLKKTSCPMNSFTGLQHDLNYLYECSVHDFLLALDLCNIPYASFDWKYVQSIGLPAIIKKFTSWDVLKERFLAAPNYFYDKERQRTSPLLPAAINVKSSDILYGHNLSMISEERHFTFRNKSMEMSGKGGCAMYARPFINGRWFWEVCVRVINESPVFVGVASSSLDLTGFGRQGMNSYNLDKVSGVYLHRDHAIIVASGRVIEYPPVMGCPICVQVIFDCHNDKIQFYMMQQLLFEQTIESQVCNSQLRCCYAALGICNAQVDWDLASEISPWLWACSIHFQLSSSISNGALVSAPLQGDYMTWNAKCKGKHLLIAGAGDTIIAGHLHKKQEVYEDVVLSQCFSENELFYFEIYLLAYGSNGRVCASFGITNGSLEFSIPCMLKDTSPQLDISEALLDTYNTHCGMLFDFPNKTMTMFSSKRSPVKSIPLTLECSNATYRPTMKVLCNGAIIRTDFSPSVLPGALQDATIQKPAKCIDLPKACTRSTTQVGKLLDMELVACDGGQMSSAHGPRNCLAEDSSVYSSRDSHNVHLTLKHQVDTPFCASFISLRGPGPGYAHPLSCALVFITSYLPDIDEFIEYDNFTPEQFACLPFPAGSHHYHRRNESLPVAYFILDGCCSLVSKQLAGPVCGRYVVCKLINASITCISRAGYESIDLGFLGIYGTYDLENGPAYNDEITLYSCDECKRTPMVGLTYKSAVEGSTIICSSCFDDGRGISSIYCEDMKLCACRANDMQEVENSAKTCMPRQDWRRKIESLYNAVDMESEKTRSSEVNVSEESESASAKSVSNFVSGFENCELYSCGQNNYGELGLGHCNSTSKLEHVTTFSHKTVQSIAGGNEVLVAVMKDGAVFTCGLNKSGQCGNGTFEERVVIPTAMKAFNDIPVSMVAASNGCEHMLAVTLDGAVYSWGYNDRGQLGLGLSISKSHTPRLIESLREKYVIVSAAVSYHHSAVVSSKGDLLTFGMNDCGQLGLDHVQHQHTPQLVEAVGNKNIHKVACGLFHTIALTSSGDVYGFGKNEYGQLGLGHTRNAKIPMVVKIPNHPRGSIGEEDCIIVEVCCGYYHTVTISAKGKVVSWGRNDYGQLGIGSKEHKNSPQFVPLPLTSRVENASCGCYHSLILLANARVMVFGRNNKGQLGVTPRTLPSADLPLPMPFHPVSSDDVVSIAAGFYCSYVLTGKKMASHCTNTKQEHSNGKDSDENPSGTASLDNIFGCLMTEMDANIVSSPVTSESQDKLEPLSTVTRIDMHDMKLHCAAWALLRVVMYQSAITAPIQPQLFRDFLSFLMETLNSCTLSKNELTEAIPDHSDLVESHESMIMLQSCFALKNACIGLFRCALPQRRGGSNKSLFGISKVFELYPQCFNNQIMWVILCCGAANATIGRSVSSNLAVLKQVLSNFDSKDLTTATIALRVGMLVFPFNSVQEIDKIYQAVSLRSSAKFLSIILQIIGSPLITRPKLCPHELGLECDLGEICKSSRCRKNSLWGVSVSSSTGTFEQQMLKILDFQHVAIAKSAECIEFIRYMAMHATWRVAINDMMAIYLQKCDSLTSLHKDIVLYYFYMNEREDMSEDSASDSEVRNPEISSRYLHSTGDTSNIETRLPAHEHHATTDTDHEDEVTVRQKEALNRFRAAQRSMNDIARILAAVSILGGHIEPLREGCAVLVKSDDMPHRNHEMGSLSSITVDPASIELTAEIVVNKLSDSTSKDAKNSHFREKEQAGKHAFHPSFMEPSCSFVKKVPLKAVYAIERVPPAAFMFTNLRLIFDALSSFLTLQANLRSKGSCNSEEDTEIQQMMTEPVRSIIGTFFQSVQRQIHWRSMKALTTIFKQLSQAEFENVDMVTISDSRLLERIISVIDTESLILGSTCAVDPKSSFAADACWSNSVSMDELHIRWLSIRNQNVQINAEKAVDAANDFMERYTLHKAVSKLGEENTFCWGIDAMQSPRKSSNAGSIYGKYPFLVNKMAQKSRHSSNMVPVSESSYTIPSNAWGILVPLPVFQDTEEPLYTSLPSMPSNDAPYPLTTSTIRVGRAPDVCDLVVNDRSVSGRHFHLRRIHGSQDDEFYELQDFSKNGTIVNGVRVHGTSVRISNGTRISLILSRGGLVSYEFQLRSALTEGSFGQELLTSHLTAMLSSNVSQEIFPPPAILSIMLPTESTVASAEPRSPAQMQNRGQTEAITQAANDGTRAGSRRQSLHRLDNFRNRLASQGLRLVTCLPESDVPRALVSPNPAMDSPRAGGFTSPRSSMLAAPATPALGSPTTNSGSTLPPQSLLSPASFQQQESSAYHDVSSVEGRGTASYYEVSDQEHLNAALRTALDRESLQRDNTSDLVKPRRLFFDNIRTMLPSALANVGFPPSPTKDRLPFSDLVARSLSLRIRVEERYGCQIAMEYCEKALENVDGDLEAAFALVEKAIQEFAAPPAAEAWHSSNVSHMSRILNQHPSVCARALQLSDNNIRKAIHIILFEKDSLESLGLWPRDIGAEERTSTPTCTTQNEELLRIQDPVDDNVSYLLTDSSDPALVQRHFNAKHGPSMTRPSHVVSKLKHAMPRWSWLQYNAAYCDRGLDKKTLYETENEEEELAHFLKAAYARKFLSFFVLMYQSQDAKLMSLPTAIWRRLILSMGTHESNDVASKVYDCEKIHRLQLTLPRVSQFNDEDNLIPYSNYMQQAQTISIHLSAIDACEPSVSLSKLTMQRLLSICLRAEMHKEKENAGSRNSGTAEQLFVETILNILSRGLTSPCAALMWGPLNSSLILQKDPIYAKGPLAFSCGLQVVIVTTFERLWSIPAADPLVQYRHKWRKIRKGCSTQTLEMKTVSEDPLTLWRPMLPYEIASDATSLDQTHNESENRMLEAADWFSLGDILTWTSGPDNFPGSQSIFVYDARDGSLAAPLAFDRIDISGKGLPQNAARHDPNYSNKQMRSLWWPVAPPGYVSLGCVAGTKDDPYQSPHIDSVRCIHESLTRTLDASSYSLRFPAKYCSAPKTLMQLSNAVPDSDISLRVIRSEFIGSTLVPTTSITENEGSEILPSMLQLTEEDGVLCSPVTIPMAFNFLNVFLECIKQQKNAQKKSGDHRSFKVEEYAVLASALFALLRQVLQETNPSRSRLAINIVRALISVIDSGGVWHDKAALLYCRSKVMALNQQQEHGMMISALCQAFIELILAVQEQNRVSQIRELHECLTNDTTLTYPYRFQYAEKASHERLVSHSSKLLVTRYDSEVDRKFLLEYHPEMLSNVSASAPEEAYHSCRFEHTPELVVTLQGREVKAEIVYYEITIIEWKDGSNAQRSDQDDSNDSVPTLAIGFSSTDYPLEGLRLGMQHRNTSGSSATARSFSYLPFDNKLYSSDSQADQWSWGSRSFSAITPGDTFGCGIRLDTFEIFVTRNGHLLGTAFSSVMQPFSLHPTITCGPELKILANFGSSISTQDDGASDSTNSSSRVQFKFSFHPIDYDNLMQAFDWYESLSQVYGIMKALMDDEDHDKIRSGRPKIPDEFMLSSDNFLSQVSKDVCIRVESNHPYDLELHEALVSIPLAISIRVQLDPQCQTAHSHCLQILQGGGDVAVENPIDGAQVEAGVESEVRAFNGSCGGQEVMIEGGSFIWRFPVQSNFQSRVDRVRKGPYLKLENRDTRLSLSRDKGWQTAIGVARFESSVHVWEVRITFVTASSNVFLGVARKDVRLDSYLGKDNRGWGWIGNRALWHNGSKQRGAYGEKFKSGDVVRMTLDLKRGTLSYALNGKDLGIAFGPGGTGSKLEGVFYPGFALYNQRDCVDLIGGHRVDDGSDPEGNHDYVDADNDAAIGYSDEEYDRVDESDHILDLRLESAHSLSQMGFPLDWCEYALRQRDDDVEQAADFILSNLHAMDILANEDARISRSRGRISEGLQSRLADSTMIDASENTQTESRQLKRQGSTSDKHDIEKWGIAFTAVPEFSVTGRRLLAARYTREMEELHASQSVFTLEQDESIVKIVNEYCETRAEALLSCDPLRIPPDDFEPTEEQYRRFTCLQNIALTQLQMRFLILRNFNCRLQLSLSFIDFSADDEHSLLAKGVRRLRKLIFQHVKLAWWLSIIKSQQTPPSSRPEIEVDRHRSLESPENVALADTVFYQAFEQLHSVQPSLLRGTDRAFKCQFVGEFGDDFGGLYRECLAQMSSELQSSVSPLLKPCPNAVKSVGENREQFVPRAQAWKHAKQTQMNEFLGKLIGIAIRTKTPLDLHLPTVIWKLLVKEFVTRSDIEQIHEGCFHIVDTIRDIERHGITESTFEEVIDTHYTVESSSGDTIPLVPGGENVRVSWNDKDVYACAVETYRINEFRSVCEDISRGIATILPAITLPLFTWKEFATLVCGKATVDIELLRRRTVYGDGCQITDRHIPYFWDVLNEFTDEQKSSFLRFVWGRSRLPTHAADFTQDFKISGLPKSAQRPDTYLPVAHTCFFSIDLPAYSSRQVMREKLLYAITHCQAIDADNTTVAQRAGQGIHWAASTSSGGIILVPANPSAGED